MALKDQESHFSNTPYPSPHPNFKLARAEVRPGVGFLARTELSLLSLLIEASGWGGSSLCCVEEWLPSSWPMTQEKSQLGWFSREIFFFSCWYRKRKDQRLDIMPLFLVLHQLASNIFKDNYGLRLPFCPFSVLGAAIVNWEQCTSKRIYTQRWTWSLGFSAVGGLRRGLITSSGLCTSISFFLLESLL